MAMEYILVHSFLFPGLSVLFLQKNYLLSIDLNMDDIVCYHDNCPVLKVRNIREILVFRKTPYCTTAR